MRIALLALLVLLICGCFEKEGWIPTGNDKKMIAENILKTVPDMKFKVNAELEDRATYLGLDVDKDVVNPGETMELSHYDIVPGNVQKEITEKATLKEEEE